MLWAGAHLDSTEQVGVVCGVGECQGWAGGEGQGAVQQQPLRGVGLDAQLRGAKAGLKGKGRRQCSETLQTGDGTHT